MNKNDKFHGAEFEVNTQAISDEELDAVSGGGLTTNSDGKMRCPNCGEWISEFSYPHNLADCLGSPLLDPMLNS